MLSRTLASMPAASKIRLWQAGWVSICTLVLVKQVNSGFTAPSPCSHTCLERARAWSRQQRLLLRQYLYFCTSKASKLRTLDVVSCVSERREGDQRSALLQQRQLPPHPEQAQVAKSSAYVSIRQHTSAYVSIRQHTSAYVTAVAASGASTLRQPSAYVSVRQRTSAYVSVRQRTSAYVSVRQRTSAYLAARGEEAGVAARDTRRKVDCRVMPDASVAYVSIRQHTSAYVSIRQHTSAYVSIRAGTQSRGPSERQLRQ
jgi:hypothetical protein